MRANFATTTDGCTKMLDKMLNEFFILICHIRLHMIDIHIDKIELTLKNIMNEIYIIYQSHPAIAQDMRYCLMAAMDEAILSHPDASKLTITRPFVTQDFNDGHYGINTFKILSQSEHYPETIKQNILKTYYLILSLGFSGQYKNDPQKIEHLRLQMKPSTKRSLAEYPKANKKVYSIPLICAVMHMLIASSCAYYFRINYLTDVLMRKLVQFLGSHYT